MDIKDIDPNPEDPCSEYEAWSECGIVLHNSVYGKYVVASRRIEEGELIIEELPLSVSPYATSDRLPLCLTCGRDLAFSERCSKCRWPICSNSSACERDPVHSDAECPIFVANGVRPGKLSTLEYTAVEVIRCLILRSHNPDKWNRLTRFEPHAESRKLSEEVKTEMEFIVEFVREKCELKQYEFDIIEKIAGIIAVNTFWGFKDIQRYISLLFDEVSLLAHDCDPNTTREIVQKKSFVDGALKKMFSIKIVASRTIESGEQITTHYTDCSENVFDRRKNLKKIFYFDCGCSRCVKEMMEVVEIKE